MELFDIIKNIFNQKEDVWKNVSKNDKSRNFFMINRIMSIQFPIQAHQFNKLKVSPPYVVDWWRNTLNTRFTKVPTWIYTKTQKSEKSKKNISEVNQLTEEFIREKFQITKRDLVYLKTFYPDRYVKWIEDLSEQLGFHK
jgi:hypothetical protein